MIAPLAASAVRIPRTAAARRAWWVMLFLGGLLGLGFLFGASARAAEADVLSAERIVGSVPQEGQDTRDGLASTAPDSSAVEDGAARPAQPDTGEATPVTTPVGGIAPGDHELPELPAQRPVVPDTGADEVGQEPGYADHVGDRADAPASTGGGDAYGEPDASVPGVHGQASATAHAAPATGAVAGQRDGDGRQDRFPTDLPGAPVPNGPASQQAGDGHPRGGDAQFAATAGAPLFGLVPGAVRTTEGAPTRERSSGILEFPG